MSDISTDKKPESNKPILLKYGIRTAKVLGLIAFGYLLSQEKVSFSNLLNTVGVIESKSTNQTDDKTLVVKGYEKSKLLLNNEIRGYIVTIEPSYNNSLDGINFDFGFIKGDDILKLCIYYKEHGDLKLLELNTKYNVSVNEIISVYQPNTYSFDINIEENKEILRKVIIILKNKQF